MLPLFYKRLLAPNERPQFFNTLHLAVFISSWFGGEMPLYF